MDLDEDPECEIEALYNYKLGFSLVVKALIDA
jgi:hypothetical protein